MDQTKTRKMKILIRKPAIVLVVLLLTFGISAYAQKKAEIKIKTSAECEMCKATIEKTLKYTKGVKSATLDLTTREVTIVYNSKKITPDQLRKVISDAGYDADSVPANNKAYKKLQECCSGGKNCKDPNHKHGTDSIK